LRPCQAGHVNWVAAGRIWTVPPAASRPNPNSEGRIPKAEATPEHFGLRVWAFFRPSDFGLRVCAHGLVVPSKIRPRQHARTQSSLSLTANRGFSGGYVVFPGPFRIPAPNPTNVPNRCSLKPLTPETPEKALLLVYPPRRVTPQVVYRNLPYFQLPYPSSRTRWPTQETVTAARTRLRSAHRDRNWPRVTGNRCWMTAFMVRLGQRQGSSPRRRSQADQPRPHSTPVAK
jgi:hypothetical protein